MLEKETQYLERILGFAAEQEAISPNYKGHLLQSYLENYAAEDDAEVRRVLKVSEEARQSMSKKIDIKQLVSALNNSALERATFFEENDFDDAHFFTDKEFAEKFFQKYKVSTPALGIILPSFEWLAYKMAWGRIGGLSAAPEYFIHKPYALTGFVIASENSQPEVTIHEAMHAATNLHSKNLRKSYSSFGLDGAIAEFHRLAVDEINAYSLFRSTFSSVNISKFKERFFGKQSRDKIIRLGYNAGEVELRLRCEQIQFGETLLYYNLINKEIPETIKRKIFMTAGMTEKEFVKQNFFYPISDLKNYFLAFMACKQFKPELIKF